MDKVDNSSKSHIFSHSGPIIALFAKQPVAGKVKTRLTPPLTADQACQLYSVALQETVNRFLSAGLPLLICYAGEREWFSKKFPGVPLLAQHGDGLGDRMGNAVLEMFASGAGPVLLSGSDSPDLPIAFAKEALELLKTIDVATVPCCDGGYAMIGLRQPTTALFAGVPWSTSQVQAATRQRSRELGLSYQATDQWYDLDELADLRKLVRRSPQSETAGHVAGELMKLLCSAS